MHGATASQLRGHRVEGGHADPAPPSMCGPLLSPGAHWACRAISHWHRWQQATPGEECGLDSGKNHKQRSTSTFTHKLPLYVPSICLLSIKNIKTSTAAVTQHREELLALRVFRGMNVCDIYSSEEGNKFHHQYKKQKFFLCHWFKRLKIKETWSNALEAMLLHCLLLLLLLLPLTPMSEICSSGAGDFQSPGAHPSEPPAKPLFSLLHPLACSLLFFVVHLSVPTSHLLHPSCSTFSFAAAFFFFNSCHSLVYFLLDTGAFLCLSTLPLLFLSQWSSSFAAVHNYAKTQACAGSHLEGVWTWQFPTKTTKYLGWELLRVDELMIEGVGRGEKWGSWR